jgi:F-type H+-transporting ATPase subunit b
MLHLLNALPLGLSSIEILLHLLNFTILLIGVRFLLWKPIKKFMDKRKAEYQTAEDNSKNMTKEAEELKAKYETLLNDADKEKAVIIKNSENEAKNQAESIISNAKVEASNIIANSKKTTQLEISKIKKEMENEVVDLSVSIAGKILDREIKDKDNSKLIDDCLEEWKKI